MSENSFTPAGVAPHTAVPSAVPTPAFAAAKAALYRRYRPETFADVIGQEHVTEPLMRALDNNRIGHAYLFSGPRGCGKTTSARILARCLNCASGPTSTPCGTCPSCIELSRDGSGSLDVVEIDAASHGGVDDARELRERATFAPARDRFKIFILDEAHMVTAHGFNALLKLVEEPPAHVKFIFATTEPEKVLGTIRSRTHHYPFRLIPGNVLTRYLEHLCESEGVPVEKGVLPLVVRAGTGSARDTLSVLDQLMAGSGGDGIQYRTAVNLLGFTDGELLNSMIDAIASGDAASVFKSVDRIVSTGHDPRRFVEDLLDRLRDLIIAAAVPESLDTLLPGVPAEHLDTLLRQASVYGSAALSRAADVTSDGLNSMHGPTSPRIQLELLCARLLLPGVDNVGASNGGNVGGLAARVERMERRLGASDDSTPQVPGPNSGGFAAPVSQQVANDFEVPQGMSAREMARQAARRKPSSDPISVTAQPTAQPPAESFAQAAVQPNPEPQRNAQPEPIGSPAQPPAAHTLQPAQPGALDTEAVRTAWPNILERLKLLRRVSWMTVSNYGQVLNLRNGVLSIAFSDLGASKGFSNSGSEPLLAQAVFEELGLHVSIDVQQGQHVVMQPAQPLASTNGQRTPPPLAVRPAQTVASAPAVNVAQQGNGQRSNSASRPEAGVQPAYGQREEPQRYAPQDVQVRQSPPQQAPTPASQPQPSVADLSQPVSESHRAPQYPHAPETRELRGQPQPQAQPAPEQNLGYDEWPEVAQPPTFAADEIPPTGPIRVLNPDLRPASAHEAPAQSVAHIEHEPEFVQSLNYEPVEVVIDAQPVQQPVQPAAPTQPAAPLSRLEALTRSAQVEAERDGAANAVTVADSGGDIWAARDPQSRPSVILRPAPGTMPQAPSQAHAAPLADASGSADQARAAIAAAASMRRGATAGQRPSEVDEYYDADPADPSLEGHGMAGPEVVKRLLGGEIIEEIDNL